MPQVRDEAGAIGDLDQGEEGTGWSRRQALKLLAANVALLASGCGKPQEEIVPYVKMPERLVPGIPLKFATTLDFAGYGRGALVTSREGRPIKIEGNPLHPGSLGATDIFAEAEILNLYDPDRSQTARQNGEIRNWDDFLSAWHSKFAAHKADGGAGLRLLTGYVSSPTLLRQIGNLQKQFPNMVWHAYEPAEDDAARPGMKMAYGRALEALPRFQDADVVVALDADPIGSGPRQTAFARGLGDRRRPRKDGSGLLRLYSVESVPTLTGANADHRLAVPPDRISLFASELARGLGASFPAPELTPDERHFAQVLLRDLQAHQGRSIIFAGRTQLAEIHALTHWINAQIKAPIAYIDPPAQGFAQPGLRPLIDDLNSGKVRSLVVASCNPAYDAPANLDFASAAKRASFLTYFGLHFNETAELCEWHLPASHALESWSDLRALDGTASIVQPLIDRLYDTKTLHQLVAIIGGALDASPYNLVRETWQPSGGQDFESWWRRALHEGVIAGTASQPIQLAAPTLPSFPATTPKQGVKLVLAPDPSLWDGRFATNAWLQECPKPLTKQVWGNALALNADEAAALGARDGDLIRVKRGERHLDVPLRIQAGHARGVGSLTLGNGRTQAGAIGTGVGANAYVLRDENTLWVLDGVELTRIGGRQNLATATAITKLEGVREELYPLLALNALAHTSPKNEYLHYPSFFPARPRREPAWAMVIDNTACIGCNACVIACQAENNVPVVGPEEVEWGRIMHWIRIDLYKTAPSSGGNEAIAGFQPVPCMHCEKAPCEPVCPVAASIHDDEGLNVQVYNRCIGTRFCEANCPYKVRRFNFFGYADGQEYGNLGAEVLKGRKNPDVTVRARGVMEKCTYCVQRISQARRTAEKENREIREGEVITACQAACPTRAIVFGDLMKENSEVRKLQAEPQHYALLGHLGTQPRTTYLARVRNPNPELERGEG